MVRSFSYIQLVTPNVVVSAVSTVTMICITVFQNSLFFIKTLLVSSSTFHDLNKNLQNPSVDVSALRAFVLLSWLDA